MATTEEVKENKPSICKKITLSNCQDYSLSANIFGMSTEMCRDRGGGKQRQRWW
jgi:hypothetical protein